jgi:hypothetical protein
MWDYLKAKQSVAVYVKNLAKDGSYSRSEVVHKSADFLLTQLKAQGFNSYNQFMRYALLQEILNRNKHLPKKKGCSG